MAKIFSHYADNVDKAWYSSSTIEYSECIDNDDALKTLYVVFKNGSTYRYDDVNVMDYLKFREASSQGKALKAYIKDNGYSYAKEEPRDIGLIHDELERLNDDVFVIKIEDSKLVITRHGDTVFEYDEPSLANDDVCNFAVAMLTQFGFNVRREQ